METERLAEFLGTHALAVLMAITVSMLAATAVLWQALHRYGPAVWRRITAMVQAIAVKLAPHSRWLGGSRVLPRAWRIARRVGIQALVSLTVAMAAVTAFVEIADEIGADDDLAQFDLALSASLQRHASTELLQAFALITHLGDRNFLIVLSALIGIALLWRRRWLLASSWIVATTLGGLLNLILKDLFERSRPVHEHSAITAHGWSFPSGHASGSFVVYSLLGYLIVISTPKHWHLPAALLALALVVFVGFSRVILQVHFFSDVLAGYAFAAAWVAMWIAGLEAVYPRGSTNRSPGSGS